MKNWSTVFTWCLTLFYFSTLSQFDINWIWSTYKQTAYQNESIPFSLKSPPFSYSPCGTAAVRWLSVRGSEHVQQSVLKHTSTHGTETFRRHHHHHHHIHMTHTVISEESHWRTDVWECSPHFSRLTSFFFLFLSTMDMWRWSACCTSEKHNAVLQQIQHRGYKNRRRKIKRGLSRSSVHQLTVKRDVSAPCSAQIKISHPVTEEQSSYHHTSLTSFSRWWCRGNNGIFYTLPKTTGFFMRNKSAWTSEQNNALENDYVIHLKQIVRHFYLFAWMRLCGSVRNRFRVLLRFIAWNTFCKKKNIYSQSSGRKEICINCRIFHLNLVQKQHKLQDEFLSLHNCAWLPT